MIDDDDDQLLCPLCVEEIDLSDKNFLPCPCGYRVCIWCWHHIRENLNGLCPACRQPYNADPHLFSTVESDFAKKSKDRKQKEKDKKEPTKVVSRAPSNTIIDRRHLHNFRVVQRNLMYTIGIPANLASEELLKKPEYFGQYGKIAKIVIHKNHTTSHTTVSAYVTFVHKEDARAAIQAIDSFHLDGHLLRASFGTTKYCNNFIRNMGCNNPDCVYLHELGDDDDRFTKEEIQGATGPGQMKPLVPSPTQTVVVGMGGPSGTGRRPTGEPCLPPPSFLQEIPASKVALLASAASAPTLSRSSSSSSSSWSTANPGAASSTPSPSQTPIPSPSEPSLPDSVYPALISSSPSSSSESKPQSRSLPPPSPPLHATSIHGGTPPRLSEKEKEESLPSPQEQQKEPSSLASPSVSAHDHPSSSPSPYGSKPSFPSSGQPRPPFPLPAPSPSSFNGLGACAVFPVPVSSLSVSIWSTILASSSSSLSHNPYSRLLPVSELLDLTLPPVDAIGIPGWPKPLSYYRQDPSLLPPPPPQPLYPSLPPPQSPQISASLLSHSASSPSSSLVAPGSGPLSRPPPSLQTLQQMFPSAKIHTSPSPSLSPSPPLSVSQERKS